MFQKTQTAFLAGMVFFVSAMPLKAAPVWNLIGLEDRSINCILADDTTLILAGTSLGLSAYYQQKWFDIDVGKLPVTSLERIPSGAVAVGAGNGSKSDAVYIGTRIRGEPYYQLRFQHYFISPTAMEAGRTVTATDTVTVLSVGGGNIVAAGSIVKDSLISPRLVKIPPYAFGVEQPWCADLLLFKDTTLYAGGYDLSPKPGPGGLLQLVKDSLEIVRRLNVSALAQGSFMEVAPVELVIGTTDTGVIFLNVSAPRPTFTVIPAPNKEAIADLATMPGMWSDILVAAVRGGVYTNINRSATWSALGKIPRAPNCLSNRGVPRIMGAGELLAGTVEGVYLYAEPPVTSSRSQCAQSSAARIKPLLRRDGEVLLQMSGIGGNGATVDIFTPSGKMFLRITAQSAVSFRLPATGVYYYRCSTDGKTESRGVLVNIRQ